MPDINKSSFQQPKPRPGPYLAKVISHQLSTYMGQLEVEILRPVGSSGGETTLHTVSYMSPFFGQTSVSHIGTDPDDYNNTQKSYGMWMIPPDYGSTVVVFFIDGDPKRGYWMGCVPDENMNFMMPGIAATEQVVEGGGRIPVAEYNKKRNLAQTDSTQFKKPRHPIADVLEQQGLLKDDTRGITTSSARRETPSMVFGISSPGPIDKRAGAKTGKIGKKEYPINNAPVSRLGGTTFVMDDGDDKFLRKLPAHQGPPEYVAVEQGETGGDPTLPHNELFRIRTRTGHQILLHNTEDLIYIGNARGTTWIELTSLGKIDIYAKDSVSIHTENDLNVTADRDINFTAKRNINLNAKNIFAESSDNVEIKIGKNGKITAGLNMNLKASGGNVNIQSSIDTNIKADGKIIQNAAGYYFIPGAGGVSPVSSVADVADSAPKANRIPLVEPWAGHEHLDPGFSLADSTEASASPSQREPSMFKKYTTSTDTFRKIKGGQ